MLGVLEVVEYSLKERFNMRCYQVSYLRLQDVIGVCLSYCCLSGTTPGIISAFEDVILDGFETKHVTG